MEAAVGVALLSGLGLFFRKHFSFRRKDPYKGLRGTPSMEREIDNHDSRRHVHLR